MEILVLPVSGAHFPIQLGILTDLCEDGYKPELIMGSSGGNVCAYTALGADWQPRGIYRIAQTLNSDLFFNKHPIGGMIPSLLAGIFRESIFGPPTKIISYFDEMFCPGTIVRSEIWSGATNWKTGQAQLFCNLSEDKAKLKFQNGIFESHPHIYLDGNVEKIAKTSVASATIPVILPLCDIDDDAYCDGGALFVSPLPCLQDSISDVSENFHISYINCLNLGTPADYGDKGHFSKKIIDLTRIFLRGSALHDRSIALRLLGGGMIEFEEGIANINKVKELNVKKKQYSRSLIEYYPRDVSGADKAYHKFHRDVKLFTFRGEDVISMMDETRHEYGYRMWGKV